MRKEIWNIPNLLCYIRFLLIPLFVYEYLTAEGINDYYIAGGIIFIAGLTDFADGYIARKFNMVTELGKALDPIADKMMQVAIVIALLSRYEWIMWVFVLFVVKECAMAIMYLILAKQQRTYGGALWFGKISTAIFYVTMGILIFVPLLPLVVVNTLIAITFVGLFFSFGMYILSFRDIQRQVKAKAS